MAKITFQVELPDAMVKDFHQHLRNFEQRAPDEIHLQIWVDAPDMKMDELIEAMQASPGYNFQKIVPLTKKS